MDMLIQDLKKKKKKKKYKFPIIHKHQSNSCAKVCGDKFYGRGGVEGRGC